MINFEKAAQSVLEKNENPPLELITLAPSGGGKSYLAGTLGVKTLYLHGLKESHGYKNAKIPGGDNVVPICWDLDDEGKELDSPDASYKRILEILADGEALVEAGFKFIVLDGATEIESLIKETTLFKLKVTNKGVVNQFKTPEATLDMFNSILIRLRLLAMNNKIGYNLTCILDVKKMDSQGNITESIPKLYGYAVAEGIIQHFPDVIVVSRIMNPSNGAFAHRVQFMAGVSKTSKEATGEVKKTINYAPRLTGVGLEDIPVESIPADLKEVLKIRNEV